MTRSWTQYPSIVVATFMGGACFDPPPVDTGGVVASSSGKAGATDPTTGGALDDATAGVPTAGDPFPTTGMSSAETGTFPTSGTGSTPPGGGTDTGASDTGASDTADTGVAAPSCDGLVCGVVGPLDCGSCAVGQCASNRACCEVGLQVGALDTPGDAKAVAVDGGVALVADYDSLRVIDVSNPESPYEVSSVEQGSFAWDVRMNGTRAFVAWAYAGGVVSLDLSNPQFPSVLGAGGAPGIGITVAGDFAFTATGAGYGFEVVDVSDPTTPTPLGSVNLLQQTRHVAVLGSWALVTVEFRHLSVVDISDPSDPFEAAIVEFDGGPAGVVVRDALAYVSVGRGGLEILGVSPAGEIQRVGALSVPDATLGDLDISGDLVAVAAGPQGTIFIDVADPTSPFQVARIFPSSAAGRVEGVAIDGEYVYAAVGEAGLQVIQMPRCF